MENVKAKTAPYGSWKSPISAAMVAGGSLGLEQICLDGTDAYWIESRPEEGGRQVIVRLSGDGLVQDVTPAPFNARTRVHEYGGQSYTVAGGLLVFSNAMDGRLYCKLGDSTPRPITPSGPFRYGDFAITPDGSSVICVREDYRGVADAGAASETAEPVDAIVQIDLAGHRAGQAALIGGEPGGDCFAGVSPASHAEHEPARSDRKTREAPVAYGGTMPGARLLVEGSDFYGAPRVSPDGRLLAWLSWNHPNMPWDGTELWLGEIGAGGAVENCRTVAGGLDESILQPEWSPDSVLYFVSDRSGWWNLYRLRGNDDDVEALHPMDAEFGLPGWVLGLRTYDFAGPDLLVCACCRRGTWGLAMLDTKSLAFEPLETPYTQVTGVRGERSWKPEAGSWNQEAGAWKPGAGRPTPGQRASGARDKATAWFVASSPSEPAAVVRLDLETGGSESVRRSSDVRLEPGFISAPQEMEFATERGQTAHGFFYAPRNGEFSGPPGERPPLLVMCHGGPTDAASPSLSLGTQFWTSRGFAVMQVNYGGSTGYGRAYRERLNGQWGVVDVEDCANAARYLAAQGLVDKERMAIHGGSAGGFTALRALTTTDLFRAGAIYYGVSDLEMLALDTPKFESRSHLRLVGPYPEGRDLYRERSPVDAAERISAALILFQGLEDEVVLPRQSEAMVQAALAKGLPVAYLAFEGEGHGFRRAENIQRALEAELYFYSRVFRFELAEPIEPVPIENL
jgi:dienelactone hydrolase